MWKHRTRIVVVKYPPLPGETPKLLNYQQFYRLFFQIKEYGSLDQVSKDDIVKTVGEVGNDDFECVICMDNKPDIVLPCGHPFCQKCIEMWNKSNQTCPLCRQTVTSEDDMWVLAASPSSQDLGTYFSEFLDKL
jgi:hypothetical protein